MVGGEYYHAFGISKLEEDFSSISQGDVLKNSAYLHETIHYLQNFGSLYGVFQAINIFSDYLGMIINIQNGIFPMSAFANDEQDFIRSMLDCARGDSFDENGDCIQCHSIEGIDYEDEYHEFYDEDFPGWEDTFKERIILLFDDGKKYKFGGAAISESMAYLMEQILYGVSDYSHRLPYDACRLLYKYVMGEECDNPILLYGFCYAALMDRNPGNKFYELLQKYKNSERLSTLKEVWQFCGDVFQPIDNKILDDIDTKIDMIFLEDEENICPVYEIENKFTKEYLKERYRDIGQNIPKIKEIFIVIFDEIDPSMRIGATGRLFELIGQPMVFDVKGKLYNNNEKKLVHILAPFALSEIVLNRRSSCSLIDICKSYDGHCDEDCSTACWKHYDPHHICILRYYLYKVGLGNTQFEELEGSPFI